jgi:hypothetical protein
MSTPIQAQSISRWFNFSNNTNNPSIAPKTTAPAITTPDAFVQNTTTQQRSGGMWVFQPHAETPLNRLKALIEKKLQMEFIIATDLHKLKQTRWQH